MVDKSARVEQLPPSRIDRNPDNPRIIFREEELDRLLNSITQVGIQVPVTVYWDGTRRKFILMDGERRWICSGRLNLPAVPAIVQPRPTRLENILRMFNIHNVREQWDLLPTAYKLKEVKELLAIAHKREPTVTELSTATGVSTTTVRRSFDLLQVPRKYLNMLMRELRRPKAEQRLSEDFFLEVMKCLNTVQRYTPEVFDQVSRSSFIGTFVDKYKRKVITNIVKFRDVSRIARAERAGLPRSSAVAALVSLGTEADYSIERAFEESVSATYEARDLSSRAKTLLGRIERYPAKRVLNPELRQILLELRSAIDRILGP
jgi:ParB/RepB/Spo0J family partition protein